MGWKQTILYILSVSGVYLLLFVVYLFCVEEILKAVLTSLLWREPLRLVFLLFINPFLTYQISEKFPFRPLGLINPRLNDRPAILDEDKENEENL